MRSMWPALRASEKFVGLISPGYFELLWHACLCRREPQIMHLLGALSSVCRCVYELAYFTHYHGMHKHDAPTSKMLLLSLDWPSSFWPFKHTGLTEKEEEWITNLSCRDEGSSWEVRGGVRGGARGGPRALRIRGAV